jgi:hypothetical protein
MADYERNTALPMREVFRLADEVLASRAELKRTSEGRHSATYVGGEGTATIEAHRHGAMTTVTARTNQLRTSRLDQVVWHFLNSLPYQPGEVRAAATGVRSVT